MAAKPSRARGGSGGGPALADLMAAIRTAIVAAVAMPARPTTLPWMFLLPTSSMIARRREDVKSRAVVYDDANVISIGAAGGGRRVDGWAHGASCSSSGWADAAPAGGPRRDPAGDDRPHRARPHRPAGEHAGSPPGCGRLGPRDHAAPRHRSRSHADQRAARPADGGAAGGGGRERSDLRRDAPIHAAGRRMSELPRFRPDLLLGALLDGGVRFVIVGGLAAQAHGSPSLTGDLDICHAIDRDNLDRLAAVVVTLTTRHGDLDLLAHPDPGLDFGQLAQRALTTEIMGWVVLVASLDDLVAMKRAAGRPKDLIELEVLGALREEIDRRPG